MCIYNNVSGILFHHYSSLKVCHCILFAYVSNNFKTIGNTFVFLTLFGEPRLPRSQRVNFCSIKVYDVLCKLYYWDHYVYCVFQILSVLYVAKGKMSFLLSSLNAHIVSIPTFILIDAMQ